MSASEVAAHYENLLAEHYTWMFGADFGELVEQQRVLLDSLGVRGSGGVALDLGCGSGIHSLALAELGHDTVLGVDISPTLLAELSRRSTDFPAVRGVQADFCDGLAGIAAARSIQTAVCMGDTLTHLPDSGAVQRLFADTCSVLVPGGQFVLSFRDLTTPLTGLDRFLPVHADDSKVMLCFLEDEGDAVRVHDLVHLRDDQGSWSLSKSSYRKLRLAPAWVADELTRAGFTVEAEKTAPRGMCAISARKR